MKMSREEGGQTAVVRRVSFNEKTEECEGGQIPEVSPEKCSTPSDADSRKHTPIMFADNPESPSVSPLRADISTPEVGNSPQLPVKSPGSLSLSVNMSDSFEDSFITSLLEEKGTTEAAAEAAAVPEVKQESNDSLEVNLSNNSSTAETPSTVRRECIMCKSMFDVLLSRFVAPELD